MRRERWIAVLLAFFLGWFGAHKFYCHRVFQGVVYFLACGTGIPYIFAIVDMFRYLLMEDDEFIGRYFGNKTLG